MNERSAVHAYNTAVAQCAAGQFAAALQTTEALLRLKQDADTLNLAAVAAYRLGDALKAEQYWRGAVAAKPSFAEAHNNLGMLMHQLGRRPEAESAFEKALRIQPQNPGALHNLGRLRAEQGQSTEAERSYRRALQIEPKLTDALISLGALLLATHRAAEAEATLLKAVTAVPNNPVALFNLGKARQEQGNIAGAVEVYGRAIAADPRFADAHNNLAQALQSLGRLAEAERSSRQAVALRPDSAPFRYNLATVVALQFRFREAEGLYREVIAREPGYPDVYNNYGLLLRNLDRDTEAERAYRQALTLQPDYPQAAWNLAMLLMSQGRYPEGWPLFAARQRASALNGLYTPPTFPYPQWRGEDLTKKSIFLIGEEGIGDQIQFIRYAAILRQRGATRVTVLTRDSLVRLFGTIAGLDVVAVNANVEIAPHDYWAFLYDLPVHLGQTETAIPAQPYLCADSALAAEWSKTLTGSGLRVGLVWRGSPIHTNNANRSLRTFSQLRPLWSVPGVTFVSLQKGDEEALTPPQDQPTVMLGPQIGDLADAAAIVDQLDLVISVDTAIAHLAGALGKPCWVLVPRINSDWRWHRARTDTPWYPGVMRVFWQIGYDSWDATIAQVAAELRTWAEAQQASQSNASH